VGGVAGPRPLLEGRAQVSRRLARLVYVANQITARTPASRMVSDSAAHTAEFGLNEDLLALLQLPFFDESLPRRQTHQSNDAASSVVRFFGFNATSLRSARHRPQLSEHAAARFDDGSLARRVEFLGWIRSQSNWE
jgi:hypothetical protein